MPGAGFIGWNAMKGLNGGDIKFGSTQSYEVDEDLFENVYDEDEDILVYKGEETEAVINNNGRVKTDEDEFELPEHTYNQLIGKAHDLGAYNEILGLETEEGQTDQHIYLGEMENYTGEIEENTEEGFKFSEFEHLLEEHQDYRERLKN